MRETQLFTHLKNKVGGAWFRIENTASPGTPDCMFAACHRGRSIYALIELKICKVSPRTKTPMNLRFEITQRPWMHEFTRGGGIAVVCVLWEKAPPKKNLMFIDMGNPYITDTFNGMCYKELVAQQEGIVLTTSLRDLKTDDLAFYVRRISDRMYQTLSRCEEP